MYIKQISSDSKVLFNSVVEHPLQSWEWGEFRSSRGQKCLRFGIYESETSDTLESAFTMLIRNVGKTKFTYGYIPKLSMINGSVIQAIKDVAKKENCVFVKIEPDFIYKIWLNKKGKILSENDIVFEEDLSVYNLVKSDREVLDKFTFFLDISRSEEELLANMHHKTRYNIKVATKNGVTIEEQSSIEGIETFLALNSETTERQQFYLHSDDYFRDMWNVFKESGIMKVLIAKYKDKPLSAWILFIWNDKLFYPYGASTHEHKNVMASNLLCWEAIKFGKKYGCKSFDLWGALGPNPDEENPWYGFHRFKQGYGASLVEFIGSWDLILNPIMYKALIFGDKMRWMFLNLKKKLK
ncbi:peptidoglycan bridge formation glycyltransferase FemA/FemB family protein [Candidatus Dojkabacteria bacterium]|nr:peptidoglycan bridge formation glycyltransferase FemA/FemB family protein [Candidatus Dojkabacteria bacterium]